jgi:hypothetical protein
MLDQWPGCQIPENLGTGCDTLRVKPVHWDPVGHSKPFPKIKNGDGQSGLPPLTLPRRL